jgi:hypothetical protein
LFGEESPPQLQQHQQGEGSKAEVRALVSLTDQNRWYAGASSNMPAANAGSSAKNIVKGNADGAPAALSPLKVEPAGTLGKQPTG